jgi:hypothetical protein
VKLLVSIPYSNAHGRGTKDLELVLGAWRQQHAIAQANLLVHVAERNGDAAAAVCKKYGYSHSAHETPYFDANMLRNVGAKTYPSAEYLMWADQDMVPHMFYAFNTVHTLKRAEQQGVPISLSGERCGLHVEDVLAWTRGVGPNGDDFVRMCTFPAGWPCQPGNNIAMTRDTYGKIGPWEEEMHWYGVEDLEFSYRVSLHAVMVRTIHFTFAHILHDGGKDFETAGFRRNWAVFLTKHGVDATHAMERKLDSCIDGQALYTLLPNPKNRYVGSPAKMLGVSGLSDMQLNQAIGNASRTAEACISRSQVRAVLGAVDDVLAMVEDSKEQTAEAAMRLISLPLRVLSSSSMFSLGDAQMAYEKGVDMLPLVSSGYRQQLAKTLETLWQERQKLR